MIHILEKGEKAEQTDSGTISRPHWIRMPMFDHGFTGDYCFQCSECKALTQEFRDKCSKCGADMRP